MREKTRVVVCHEHRHTHTNENKREHVKQGLPFCYGSEIHTRNRPNSFYNYW